jgi:hypothetical protein
MTSTASTARLTGRFIARADVDHALGTAMFTLLRTHFSGVDVETFEADLLDKNWVILLEDEAGVLRGFSTLLVYVDHTLGRPVTVVYSGDTIVARDWWGSSALPVTWIRAVQQIVPRYGNQEVFWLLITSGFRTYRFLPVFFREFFPRCDGRSFGEPEVARLARARFGSAYCEESGVVRLKRPQVLVPELVDVPERRMLDPHIAFFLQRNPGYVRGDELVCITRICEDNLTPAGRRMAKGFHQPLA